MKKLLALQREFAGIIRRPPGRDLQLANPAEVRADCERLIKPSDKTTSLERAEIYNQQYWLRLLDTFSRDFPGLRWLLGDTRFDRIARAYLAAHPSRSCTLHDLGDRLPDFLESGPRFRGRRQSAAIEMARLERAMARALIADELPPIASAGLTAASVRLRLQPHITLLELHHPLDRYFTSAVRRLEAAEVASNAISAPRRRRVRPAAPLTREHVFLAVHRHADRAYLKRLDSAAFDLLHRIRSGCTLTAAIDATTKQHSHTPAWWRRRLAAWFRDWSALGWLARRGTRSSASVDPLKN